MPHSSWWEETERFRDLDEIVERAPGGIATGVRWLLVAAVAACAGLLGWHTLGDEGRHDVLALTKFDQALARHTPQQVGDAADPEAAAAVTRSAGASPGERRPRAAHHEAELREPRATPPRLRSADRWETDASAADDAPSDDGSYYIQVASLRSKKRAELLMKRLSRQGHHADVRAVGLRNRGWWHSVRIGPFGTRMEAEIYRLEFEPFQGHTAVVVPRARGPFHVQVASVRSQSKADDLVEKLRQRGHHARRSRARSSDDGGWYLVRIGPFPTRAEAEAYRTHFAKLEDHPAVVVPYERDEAEPTRRGD